MKHRLTIAETASVASMLFGLFFGAGNLIFPAYMGQAAGARILSAGASPKLALLIFSPRPGRSFWPWCCSAFLKRSTDRQR